MRATYADAALKNGESFFGYEADAQGVNRRNVGASSVGRGTIGWPRSVGAQTLSSVAQRLLASFRPGWESDSMTVLRWQGSCR